MQYYSYTALKPARLPAEIKVINNDLFYAEYGKGKNKFRYIKPAIHMVIINGH